MAYQSQQILAPVSSEFIREAPAQKIKMRDNDFSKVLSKNMRSSESAENNEKMRSDKAKMLRKGINNHISRKRQLADIPNTGEYDNSVVMNNPLKGSEPMKRSDASQIKADSKPTDLIETDVPSIDVVEQVEELQAVMVGIIELIQKLPTVEAKKMVEGSSLAEEIVNNKEQPIISEDLIELGRALESEIKDLLKVAHNLEGTKTSEIAVGFADRLTKLIEDDFSEMIGEINGQIILTEPDKLKSLIEKMLYEAETTKMGITSEAVGEIIIPAINHGMVQSANISLKQSQGIETPKEHKVGIHVAPEQETVVETKGLQSENGFGKTWDGGTKTVAFTEPKEEKIQVPDFQSLTDSVSFADIIKTEDNIPVLNDIAKEPVDVRTVVIRQVIEKAGTILSENKTEMVMQLKPESLGKISLRVIHERGEIIARFVAENDQVKSILESNMQLLKDSLQRSGVSVQSLSVSVGQQDAQQSSAKDQGWQSEPGSRKNIAEPAPVIDLGQQTYVYSGHAGGVLGNEESEINLTA